MADKTDIMSLLGESKAEYKRLGKSGLKVSVPILGAMSIGSAKWQPWVIEEEESLPLLKAAYDRGITTWDTANVYSNGVSEEIVGKAIKKYNLPRDKLVILTKCFGYVGEDPSIRTIQFNKELPQLKDYVNQGASAFGSTTRSEGEKQAANQSTGNTERDKKIIGRVEEIAKKHDWKMSHVALAWINKRIASPIIGFSSADRMDEALASRGKELSEEEEKYLEELYEPVRIVGHS
ncbi:hypothetical protein PTNB29_06989 [Pyrenophora teres f. teres]|nr:hypothetical protein PTNB29_06989 [Pyrenophora teres f. teres]